MNTRKNSIIKALLAAAVGLFFGASTQAAESAPLKEPVKSVLDHYLMIQTDLANDSAKRLNEHAIAIAKAVRGDEMKMLSPEVAVQAETLAKAKDIKAAREAFKPLSASLVKYLSDNKVPSGTYHEGYCPMVRANWLQKEAEVRNPYMGKAMLECGTLKH